MKIQRNDSQISPLMEAIMTATEAFGSIPSEIQASCVL